MVTPLEILDSAMKIGLGALISGTAAFLIARLNHTRDIEKTRANRRRELLEEIAEKAEKFNSATIRYWAILLERVAHEELSQSLPPERADEWKAADELLNNSFEDITNAESKLFLLGETQCQTLLRRYVRDVSEFSTKAFPTESVLRSDVDQFKVRFMKGRKEFFETVSAVYKRT
jgi:hypothetical protein